MPAKTTWYEQNGAPTGTPAGGKESVVKNCDWKSEDSPTTPREEAPVSAGECSFNKYNYVGFTGTFNKIKDVRWAHTDGVLGEHIGLLGKVSSAYEQPTQEPMQKAMDITNPIAIQDGMEVLLSANGPNGFATPELRSSGYTQYLETQVITMLATTPGDSEEITLTLQYKEN